MLELAKKNYKASGIILAALITFILVVINPATEENPLWYGVVMFKDVELAIGIFFGVYFALKFRDPDESPLKFGIKMGFIIGVLDTILPGLYMWLLQVIFVINIIGLLTILGFLLITAITMGLIIGALLGWYYMSKEGVGKQEERYGEDFFRDLTEK